ncbi:response regulator [Cyclobacterium sp.]|uniref:response regulator n=1 Tax=unclassified Cyclobacterium TaxID=2615055 RepID=UPI003970F41F
MSNPIKILIVDDEMDVEMLFRQQFRKEIRSGMLELDFAFSGEEALKLLGDEAPPQVVYVFSDINMPGMTGLELLEKMQSRFPQVKVSMISAYGDRENFNKAMSFGAKGFFTKPIDFKALKDEVQQIIPK